MIVRAGLALRGEAMGSEFRRKQIVIVAMAAPAFLVVGTILYFARALFGFVPLPADETSARLAFAVQCLFLPGCMLWIGVQAAGRRWAYPGAIDGSRFPDNHGLEINLRYNLNTLEQFVLAAIAWTNLVLVLARENLVVLPAMAFLFVVGRVTFWVGYLWRSEARAFGMVLTALPTAGSFVWLLVYWIGRLV
jgi:hypothetical protein